MRRLAVLILLASPLVASAEGEAYAPKEDQFTIRFPGEVTEQSEKNDVGTTDYIVRHITDKGIVFLIRYGDTELRKDPTDLQKNAFFLGARKPLQGRLLSEKKISLGDYPGRDFLVRLDDTHIMRMQVYLVNARAYTLMVIGPDESAVRSPTAEQFFASFNFPQGPPAAGGPELGKLCGMALVFGLPIGVGVLWYYKAHLRPKKVDQDPAP
jgi:hypothetical protein